MEEIEEAERPVGNASKHVKRVPSPQSNVGQMLIAYMAKRCRNSVEERLRADKAMVGQHIRAIGEMLARTETDLEMKRAILAEQPFSANLALWRDLDLGQQFLDELFLALSELVAARAAIESIER
jgi:hypothetical protein